MVGAGGPAAALQREVDAFGLGLPVRAGGDIVSGYQTLAGRRWSAFVVRFDRRQLELGLAIETTWLARGIAPDLVAIGAATVDWHRGATGEALMARHEWLQPIVTRDLRPHGEQRWALLLDDFFTVARWPRLRVLVEEAAQHRITSRLEPRLHLDALVLSSGDDVCARIETDARVDVAARWAAPETASVMDPYRLVDARGGVMFEGAVAEILDRVTRG